MWRICPSLIVAYLKRYEQNDLKEKPLLKDLIFIDLEGAFIENFLSKGPSPSSQITREAHHILLWEKRTGAPVPDKEVSGKKEKQITVKLLPAKVGLVKLNFDGSS
ncbi:hypothetical protein SUGI_1164800 [Cryptomeria japonica]|nr:hypothetical protein SUGI_1164800 [Cryptomeria japonica]